MAFASSVPITSLRPHVNSGELLCKSRFSVAPRVKNATARITLVGMTASASATTAPILLTNFLADAEDLGTMRFISISNGAVLETVGRFDYGKKEFTNPKSGDRYLSIASAEQTFELHLNLTTIVRLTLSKEESRLGGHIIYVIRMWRADQQLALSCMLQWDPSQGVGNYFSGVEEKFMKLLDKYGSELNVAAPQ